MLAVKSNPKRMPANAAAYGVVNRLPDNELLSSLTAKFLLFQFKIGKSPRVGHPESSYHGIKNNRRGCPH